MHPGFELRGERADDFYFFRSGSFGLPAIRFPPPVLLLLFLLLVGLGPIPLIPVPSGLPCFKHYARVHSVPPDCLFCSPFTRPPRISPPPLPPTMTFESNRNHPWPAPTVVPQVPESSTSKRKRTPSDYRRKRLPGQRRQSSSVPDQATIGSSLLSFPPSPPPPPPFPQPLCNPLALGHSPLMARFRLVS